MTLTEPPSCLAVHCPDRAVIGHSAAVGNVADHGRVGVSATEVVALP